MQLQLIGVYWNTDAFWAQECLLLFISISIRPRLNVLYRIVSHRIALYSVASLGGILYIYIHREKKIFVAEVAMKIDIN